MTLTVATPTLATIASDAGGNQLDVLVAAWLARQRSAGTRETYGIAFRLWRRWCAEHGIDPLQAIAPHFEIWQRTLEQDGKMPRTIYGRLAAVASFYGYLVEQEVLEKDPMRTVRRPKIERVSPSSWLKRPQLADLLAAGAELGVHQNATLHLLVLNGLRVGELCSLNVESLSMERYTPTITFTRKGGKQGKARLSRPTEDAVRRAIGNRTSGPLLLNQWDRRMNRACVQRIIDQALKGVHGAHGRITPHTLRHSWTTAALDAHVPADQVQFDGGWSDQRMVTYYSHGHDAAEKAATHAVTAFIYGAA